MVRLETSSSISPYPSFHTKKAPLDNVPRSAAIGLYGLAPGGGVPPPGENGQ